MIPISPLTTFRSWGAVYDQQQRFENQISDENNQNNSQIQEQSSQNNNQTTQNNQEIFQTFQSTRVRLKPSCSLKLDGLPHPILLHVAVRDNNKQWVEQLLKDGCKTNVVDFFVCLNLQFW